MHLTLVTFGSRGDVEPFAALGAGLAAAGHDVRLVTHGMFRSLVAATGVEFVPARGRSTKDLLESDEGRALLRHRNPVTALRRLTDLIAPEVETIYADVLAAADGSDAVLCFPATFPALDVAAHLRLPVVQVHHVPAVPTRAFPLPVSYLPLRTLGGPGNRLSYAFDGAVTWRLMRTAADAARDRVLGSPPLTARRALARRTRRAGALVGVSPHVLAPPADWPGDTVTCGYWWAGQARDGGDGRPPLDAATERFLATGPPPVFLTLGSTPVDDPAATTAAVIGAAADAGVRLVLQRGWSGLGDGAEAEHVQVVGDVPYPQLFERVAAVVHHGGAGTTALGLRHGRPTLAIPAVADQFFWGHRLSAIGVGPPPVPLRRLSRARLAERLRALAATQAYATRAAAIGSALRHEDGRAVAAAATERFLAA